MRREYQHNDLVGDGDQRHKNKPRAVRINDNEDVVDDAACIADIVRTQHR